MSLVVSARLGKAAAGAAEENGASEADAAEETGAAEEKGAAEGKGAEEEMEVAATDAAEGSVASILNLGRTF